MWKNKHVLTALLVAPVLALIAYFAVDQFVSEKPHKAVPGTDYPLVAKSNCRYASGRCVLENEDFRLTLSATDIGARSMTLDLESRFPLSSATAGLAPRMGAQSVPVALSPRSGGEENKRWSAELPAPAGPDEALQIVVSAGGSRYFAEVPTVFLIPEQ